MSAYNFSTTGKVLDTVNGRIHYHEAGEGPALLLLHGSGPGVTAWANYQNNLPVFAREFHCILPDFPGYGKSEAREGLPVETCIDAIVELMDALGIERAHIIGNSLGGIVGSHIAARMPGRVSRFITIGGIGLNLFSAFPGEGLNLLTEFVEDPTRERVEQWLRSMVYDQSLVTDELIDTRFEQAIEPVTFASTRRLYSREAITGIAGFREGMGAVTTIEHLANIQAPTLIVWGRDDRVSPMDIGLIPMRIIPDAELHIFPRCGHWAMIEKKHEFESLTMSFLARPD